MNKRLILDVWWMQAQPWSACLCFVLWTSSSDEHTLCIIGPLISATFSLTGGCRSFSRTAAWADMKMHAQVKLLGVYRHTHTHANTGHAQLQRLHLLYPPGLICQSFPWVACKCFHSQTKLLVPPKCPKNVKSWWFSSCSCTYGMLINAARP